MPRPLEWGMLGASTIILSIDIDKYAFICGSNSYESDVTFKKMIQKKCSNLKSRATNFVAYEFTIL